MSIQRRFIVLVDERSYNCPIADNFRPTCKGTMAETDNTKMMTEVLVDKYFDAMKQVQGRAERKRA